MRKALIFSPVVFLLFAACIARAHAPEYPGLNAKPTLLYGVYGKAEEVGETTACVCIGIRWYDCEVPTGMARDMRYEQITYQKVRLFVARYTGEGYDCTAIHYHNGQRIHYRTEGNPAFVPPYLIVRTWSEGK